VLALVVLVSGASSVLAASDIAPYNDERDSGYLKVLYRFVYPVGKLAEVFVFRPIHAFAGATLQPDPDSPAEEDAVGACITFRPMRKCGRK
jgi:hypothetical protein